jgi:type I restriction enzyme, S subunit
MSRSVSVLSDLAYFQRGFDITKKDQRPGPYPVVSSSGVKSHHADFKVKGPGVVIGRKGSLGNIHYIESDFWPHDTSLWVKDFRANHPRYVYYRLHTIDFSRFDVGGANPTLNRNHIHGIAIHIPSLRVQVHIADILSTYDDLIENNNRRMALLEEAIHLLYREWFVYLRFSGHERAKMMKGIPEDWQRVPIGEICEVFDGPHATPKPSEEGPIFLGIGNLTESGQLDLSTVRHISEEEYPRWTKRVTPRSGDIVFTYEATLHRYGVIPQGFRGCLGRRTALLRPRTPRVDASFLLPMLRSRAWIDYMESQKLQGATVDRISIKKFPDFEMILPSDPVLEEFKEITGPSLNLCEHLQAQNQRLREARDLLLPRLMNGTFTV